MPGQPNRKNSKVVMSVLILFIFMLQMKILYPRWEVEATRGPMSEWEEGKEQSMVHSARRYGDVRHHWYIIHAVWSGHDDNIDGNTEPDCLCSAGFGYTAYDNKREHGVPPVSNVLMSAPIFLSLQLMACFGRRFTIGTGCGMVRRGLLTGGTQAYKTRSFLESSGRGGRGTCILWPVCDGDNLRFQHKEDSNKGSVVICLIGEIWGELSNHHVQYCIPYSPLDGYRYVLCNNDYMCLRLLCAYYSPMQYDSFPYVAPAMGCPTYHLAKSKWGNTILLCMAPRGCVVTLYVHPDIDISTRLCLYYFQCLIHRWDDAFGGSEEPYCISMVKRTRWLWTPSRLLGRRLVLMMRLPSMCGTRQDVFVELSLDPDRLSRRWIRAHDRMENCLWTPQLLLGSNSLQMRYIFMPESLIGQGYCSVTLIITMPIFTLRVFPYGSSISDVLAVGIHNDVHDLTNTYEGGVVRIDCVISAPFITGIKPLTVSIWGCRIVSGTWYITRESIYWYYEEDAQTSHQRPNKSTSPTDVMGVALDDNPKSVLKIPDDGMDSTVFYTGVCFYIKQIFYQLQIDGWTRIDIPGGSMEPRDVYWSLRTERVCRAEYRRFEHSESTPQHSEMQGLRDIAAAASTLDPRITVLRLGAILGLWTMLSEYAFGILMRDHMWLSNKFIVVDMYQYIQKLHERDKFNNNNLEL